MNKTEISKTISSLALACLIGFAVFGASWLLWLSVLLLAGNVFENRLTVLIAEQWMKLAAGLGHVNSRIILTIVFYLILTPFASVYRVFNKTAVGDFFGNKRSSFFDDSKTFSDKKSFEKTW